MPPPQLAGYQQNTSPVFCLPFDSSAAETTASDGMSGCGGLPVPPLFEIITEYATDLPRVSTWFGASDLNGYENGKAADARFWRPEAVVALSVKPLTLLVADTWNHCIRLCDAASGEVTLFAGEPNSVRSVDGSVVDCAGTFVYPTNLLVDPNRSNRLFVAEHAKLRVIENSVVSTLIGCDETDYAEGAGSAAKLFNPFGLALTANSKSLIFCDLGNNLIRAVDLHTRQTSAIAGDRTTANRDGRGLAAAIYYPRNCVWNRLTAKPQTELFITSVNAIRRLDVTTNELTTLQTDMKLNPYGIDQSPSGLLVVSCEAAKCIYSVDPWNGSVVRLAGSVLGESGSADGDPLTESQFSCFLFGIEVVESECCIAVVDRNCIRKVPLPPHVMIPRPDPLMDQ